MRMTMLVALLVSLCVPCIGQAARRRHHVATPPKSASALSPTTAQLLATAESLAGTPYHYGGRSSRGFDCSGFVGFVFGLHGYKLPRVSGNQMRVGKSIARWALHAGDLVFFSATPHASRVNHVGIYIGNNQFIHASVSKRRVTYDNLDEAYYSQRYLGARRIVAEDTTPALMFDLDTTTLECNAPSAEAQATATLHNETEAAFRLKMGMTRPALSPHWATRLTMGTNAPVMPHDFLSRLQRTRWRLRLWAAQRSS